MVLALHSPPLGAGTPASVNAFMIRSQPIPSRYMRKMRRTISASSGIMVNTPFFTLYPYMHRPVGMPCSNFFRMRHLQFSDTLRLSSCAKEARTVSISSPSPLIVSIFCSSKYTLTPSRFSSRTVLSSMTVFLAKREMDLHRIRSIFPARQSCSMRWNSGRPSSVPLSPSSAYTPAYSYSGLLWIISL